MIKNRVSLEQCTAWGLVVVKPHAVAEGLVPKVEQILRRVSSSGVGVVFANNESGVTLKGSCVSAPQLVEVGRADRYFDISYSRSAGEPFYPTLLEEYSGFICVFGVSTDTVPQPRFDDALDDLKGAVGIRSGVGYLRKPTGIRGALMSEVDDITVARASIREAEVAMLSNIVHTTNSSEHSLPELYEWVRGVESK